MLYILIILAGYIIGVVSAILIFPPSKRISRLEIYEHGYETGYQAGVLDSSTDKNNGQKIVDSDR